MRNCDWCKKPTKEKDLHLAWDWYICPDCWQELEEDAHESKAKKRTNR